MTAPRPAIGELFAELGLDRQRSVKADRKFGWSRRRQLLSLKGSDLPLSRKSRSAAGAVPTRRLRFVRMARQ